MRKTIAIGLLLISMPVLAEIGWVKTLAGEVVILREGSEQAAQLGAALKQQDVVITGDDGRVGITFIDNSRFSAGPGSRIELERFRFDPTTHEGEFVSRVSRGTLNVISGQMVKRSPEAMKIKTPTVILGVRGTHFVVEVKD